MRATVVRRIRDGSEYDALFPPPSKNDTTVKKSADVEDTMSLIQRTVPQTLWHTEKIAKKLKGRTLKETCSNIWHFVYGHVQYKRDKDGVEQVRSPRRTWWERRTGVDCDCYTEFISSILLNLGILHKARITKYPKPDGETPRWQHVYPVVPVNGRLNEELNDRSAYITLDCVKDEFDSEQPYLQSKDYDMRLDYLDGLDEKEEVAEQPTYEYEEYENVDLADLASIYDDEELGNIFKKIGGAVKKVAKKVGTVVKKVGDKIGDGIRIINRFVNPVTILLRNGFLLAMKINLLNVAGRLRFGYLTDAQAKERNMNLDSLKKVRHVRDRAETVYWQAGGKKANLKKAILSGKGNKDKKVPMNGLFGLDDEYMDMDEYNIIHSDPDNIDGLGEIATGAALAAATSAVAAIAGALKQIKGLFNKGGDEEKAFQSEKDNAGDASSAPKVILESEDEIRDENEIEESSSSAAVATQSDQSALPGTASLARRPATDVQQSASTTPAPAGANEGFIQKTTTWVKQNPGKSLLIAGAVAGGSYLLVKTLTASKKQTVNGMDGLPTNPQKKRKRKSTHKKQKVQTIKF